MILAAVGPSGEFNTYLSLGRRARCKDLVAAEAGNLGAVSSNAAAAAHDNDPCILGRGFDTRGRNLELLAIYQSQAGGLCSCFSVISQFWNRYQKMHEPEALPQQ